MKGIQPALQRQSNLPCLQWQKIQTRDE